MGLTIITDTGKKYVFQGSYAANNLRYFGATQVINDLVRGVEY